jgi:hypothetical protein
VFAAFRFAGHDDFNLFLICRSRRGGLRHSAISIAVVRVESWVSGVREYIMASDD